MQKYFYMLLSVITVSLAACTKDCYNCKVSTIEQEQICKEDFESTKAFNEELKALKTLGYECL